MRMASAPSACRSRTASASNIEGQFGSYGTSSLAVTTPQSVAELDDFPYIVAIVDLAQKKVGEVCTRPGRETAVSHVFSCTITLCQCSVGEAGGLHNGPVAIALA